MRKQKTAKAMLRTARKLIEEATVECYDVEEQAGGFCTMIEENLALPFTTRVLGVDVSVVAVDMDDVGAPKVVCQNGGERQRIGLTDLPLPSPLPVRRRMDCCVPAMGARTAGSTRGGRGVNAFGRFNTHS
jgi:hypothetical protein